MKALLGNLLHWDEPIIPDSIVDNYRILKVMNV